MKRNLVLLLVWLSVVLSAPQSVLAANFQLAQTPFEPDKTSIELSNFIMSGKQVISWDLDQERDPANVRLKVGDTGTASFTIDVNKEAFKVLQGNVSLKITGEHPARVDKVWVNLSEGPHGSVKTYTIFDNSENPLIFDLPGPHIYSIPDLTLPADELPDQLQARIFFQVANSSKKEPYSVTTDNRFTIQNDTQNLIEPFLSGILVFPESGLYLGCLKLDETPLDTAYPVETVNEKVYGSGQYIVTAGFTGAMKGNYIINHIANLEGLPPNTVSVNVEVYEQNPPVAEDDEAETYENTPVTISVLENDKDPDGHGISVTGTTKPPNGNVAVNEDGTVTYTPDTGFIGADCFTYMISDSEGAADTATVTITVRSRDNEPSNRPPVAVDDSATTYVNTPVRIPVLTNDSDPDDDPITVTDVTQPPHGSVVVNENGTVKYTPDSGFIGTDLFTYTITDSGGKTDTATVTVIVWRSSSSGGSSDNGGNSSDNDKSDVTPLPLPDDDNGNEVEIPPDGTIIVPPTAGPPPPQDKVSVYPTRVPAGDPTITVYPGTDVSRVYAVLPDDRKLELKKVSEEAWKVSFMVPFGTKDGPYNIRVYVVDKQGNERLTNYRITIDNSLPLLKIREIPQADGKYRLEVKALFNARKMDYYPESGGKPIAFIFDKQVNTWSAIIEEGRGFILAIDETGYEVRQDISLITQSVDSPTATEPNEVGAAKAAENPEAKEIVSQNLIQKATELNDPTIGLIAALVIAAAVGMIFGIRVKKPKQDKI